MTATMIRGSLACPPRFGTPRTSRPTLGEQAGVIAARLRKPLMPWQQHVADVALELNPDGSLVYAEVDLEVPRQEGKTELKFTIMVLRLTAMVASHGPQRVTYTMQDRKHARTRLERDYAPRLRAARGFREIPSASRDRPRKRTEWRLGMNSGVEHIQFGPDSWLQIDTPSRSGGHGDTLDMSMIDEAFAHQDDSVELGMEPAMLTRRDPQLWVISAAGDGRSFYLWRKILRGRQMVESDADSGVAYFEWSADDNDDPGDPRTWRACSPALGYTITEDRLAALWKKAQAGDQDAIDGFCRSYLCQWPEVPLIGAEREFRVISAEGWNGGADLDSRPLDPVSFGIDVAEDRRWSSIGVGARSSVGGTHIELTLDGVTRDYRPGTSWVVDRAAAIYATWGRPFAIVKGSPAWSLEPALVEAGVELTVLTTQEFAQACGLLYDGIEQGSVHHLDQGPLNVAAANVVKRSAGGDAFVWDRRSSTVDVSPFVACTLANWSALNAPVPVGSFVSWR